MPRLLPQQITDIKHLTRRGQSLNCIAQELGVPKSSVYYHFRKIRGRTYIPLEIEAKGTELEGEICGIFAGDGSQYYDSSTYGYDTTIHFGPQADEYARLVKEKYELFFRKRFSLFIQSDGGLRIRTRSKQIFNYFHKYLDFNSSKKHCTVGLKQNQSEAFQRGFLRGFLDTDGAILLDKGKYTRIIYTTTSATMAAQIQEMLELFSFRSTLQIQITEKSKPCFRVRVSSRDASKFTYTINPYKAEAFLKKGGLAKAAGS